MLVAYFCVVTFFFSPCFCQHSSRALGARRTLLSVTQAAAVELFAAFVFGINLSPTLHRFSVLHKPKGSLFCMNRKVKGFQRTLLPHNDENYGEKSDMNLGAYARDAENLYYCPRCVWSRDWD